MTDYLTELHRRIGDLSETLGTLPDHFNYLALIWNDGAFSLFERARGVDKFAARTVLGDWSVSNMGAFHRLRAGSAIRTVESRVVGISSEWQEAIAYTAQLAADFSGVGDFAMELHRRTNGYFHCPWCDQRYDTLEPFQNHLRSACNDDSYYLTLSSAFLNRNRRSRRAWLAGRNG